MEKKAVHDFEGAQYNFAGGKYYIPAFFCQQAVEKAFFVRSIVKESSAI